MPKKGPAIYETGVRQVLYSVEQLIK